MTAIPPEAITGPHPEGNPALAAAVDAIIRRRMAVQAGTGDGEGRRLAILIEALPDAAAALEAAAPHIEAAERFVLVWRDERGAEICRSLPLEAGISKIGIPLDAQSADLLRDAP